MFQTTNQFRGSLFWESLKHTNFVHSGNICVFRSGTQGWKQTHDDGHGWINSWLWMIMAPHMAWQVPVTSNPRMNLDTNCKFHGGLKSLKWQKNMRKNPGSTSKNICTQVALHACGYSAKNHRTKGPGPYEPRPEHGVST